MGVVEQAGEAMEVHVVGGRAAAVGDTYCRLENIPRAWRMFEGLWWGVLRLRNNAGLQDRMFPRPEISIPAARPAPCGLISLLMGGGGWESNSRMLRG